MINIDINKDLNIFLSFPYHTTHLTLVNNLGIVLGSKPGKVNNIEAWNKVRYPYEKGVYLASLIIHH